MKLPIYIVDAVGAAVTGLALTGSEVKISKDGGAFANAGGTVTEIGAGAYYYETIAADLVASVVVLRVEDSGGSRPWAFELRVPIAYDFAAPEPGALLIDAPVAARRMSLFLVDSSNVPVVGATPTGAQLQVSIDGAAWVNADVARFHSIGLGAYYYDPTDDESNAGLLLVKVSGVSVTTIAPALIGPFATFTISNLEPSTATAGTSGAFSYQFSVARLTPIEFDLTGLTADDVTITVHFLDRNEPYTARSHDGVWQWPFDVEPANSITDLGTEPVHVTLMPRGGWPATAIEISVAECSQAVNS